MLAKILSAILRRVAFVWRIFGSPRIIGDEKAARAVGSAWAKRAQSASSASGKADELGTWIGTRTGKVVVASSGVLVVVLVFWLALAGSGSGDDGTDISSGPVAPTPFAGPVYLTEVVALGSAVAAARENGLISTNFAHISRRIQFGEFAAAIGETYRVEQGGLATSADTEVWAFAFSGDVELKLVSGEIVKYNNLTVILDALTGQIYRIEAFYGDYESETRAPVWLRPPTPTPEVE